MRQLSKQLMLLAVLVSGTQVIDLPFTGLTIFQIVFILAGVAAVFDIVTKRIIPRGDYLVLSVCCFFSSILAYVFSTNPSWAKSYLLLGIMTAMIIFIFPNIFTKEDVFLLEKTLIRSQYIVVPFSIYSFVMYYFYGGLPRVIHLIGGLSVTLDDDMITRAQAASQVRLTLPYATPPVLSIVMAVCLIILITNNELYSKKMRMLLICIFAVILFFTGSRSGVLGLIVALVVWYFKEVRKKKITTTGLLIRIGIILGGVVFAIKMANSVYFTKLYGRTLSIDLTSDRHFLIPLDGIIIWLSSVKNFVFGIGFGSSFQMKGAHTILPAYFLNSFITLIVERGILGGIIVIELIALLIQAYYAAKRDVTYPTVTKSLFYSLLACLVSCVVYEALNCYFLIFVIGVVLVQLNGRSDNTNSFFEG